MIWMKNFNLFTLFTVCILFSINLPSVLECIELDHKLSNITRTDTPFKDEESKRIKRSPFYDNGSRRPHSSSTARRQVHVVRNENGEYVVIPVVPNLRSYYNQYNRPSNAASGTAGAVSSNSNANLATSNNQASQSNSYLSSYSNAKSQQNTGLNLERTNHQVNQAQQLLAQSFNAPNDETTNNQNIQSNQKLTNNQNSNFDESSKAFQSFNDYQPYGSASVRSNQSPAQISFETNGLDGKYFETPKHNVLERKRERTRTRPNPPTQVDQTAIGNQSPAASPPAERQSVQRGSSNQYSNQKNSKQQQAAYPQNSEPASSSGHLAYPASRLRNKSGSSSQQQTDDNYKKVLINSYSELDNTTNNKKYNKYDQTRTPATEFKLTNSRTTYLTTTTAIPITYKLTTESTTNAFTRPSLSVNNLNSNEDNEEIILSKHSSSNLNDKVKENQLDKDLRTTNYQRSFNSRSRSRYKDETNTKATMEASRTTNIVERSNPDLSAATYREDNSANVYDPVNYENEDYENRHKSNEYENTAPTAASLAKKDQAKSRFKNTANNNNQPPAAQPADYEYESEDPNDDQAAYYDKYNAQNNYGGSTPILTTTSTTTTTTTTTQPPQISTTIQDNRPRRGRFGNGPRGRLGRRRQRAGRRTTTTSTTTTTTTTQPPPLPDYYDYDDNYYDYDYNNQLNKNNQQQTSTTTTTTTLRPPPFHPARGRGYRRRGPRPARGRFRPYGRFADDDDGFRSAGPYGPKGALNTQPTSSTTTTQATTTKKLSPNYKHRPDGRIIDYNSDPNFPYELKGADLTSYPFYISIPDKMNFDCRGRHDGYYADIEHSCQIYHQCAIGQRYDFLCPNYTLFDQTTFTCRFVNTVECDKSEKHFNRNEELYVEKNDTDSKNGKSDKN